MQIIDVEQGSPEWLAIRPKYLCASDASVMMGASKNQSRSDLVRTYAIGSEKVFSEWVQNNVLNKGHEAEAAIRPHIEEIVGEDLFPVVGINDVGLDMPLLASFDGLTFAGDVGMEHKLLNGRNAVIVEAGDVPEEHVWQLEHQAAVAGLDKIIFGVSNGNPETLITCEYRPDPERRKKLLAGWKQFLEDVKSYKHVEEAPAPEGRAPDALPALRIEVQGMVSASNLDEFREHAMSVLGQINTDLQTDEDFADAEKTGKWCKDVEQRLEAAKEHAISQTADIEALFRTVDQIKEEARAKRLSLEKAVKTRKESLRAGIIEEGRKEVESHCQKIESGLGAKLPRPPADFAAAVKGKKLLSAMRDAVSDVIAAAKIEANEIAERIRGNLKRLEQENEYRFLFSDLDYIINKSPDDFDAVVTSRISNHKQAEAEKEAKAKEQAEVARVSAERRAQDAEQRAASAQKHAEERARRQAEEQRQQEEAEAAKRENDKKHRAKIHREAVAGLVKGGLEEASAKAVVTLVAKGAVQHISIRY